MGGGPSVRPTPMRDHGRWPSDPGGVGQSAYLLGGGFRHRGGGAPVRFTGTLDPALGEVRGGQHTEDGLRDGVSVTRRRLLPLSADAARRRIPAAALLRSW